MSNGKAQISNVKMKAEAEVQVKVKKLKF